MPIGLGEPVFDKLSADLGKAMLSINAVKGFDIGSGSDGVTMRGSLHNDEFVAGRNGKISTKTNNAGGYWGYIKRDDLFPGCHRPASTVHKKQRTINTKVSLLTWKQPATRSVRIASGCTN